MEGPTLSRPQNISLLHLSLLDKSELETVAKALSSGCLTLTDSGHLEISNNPGPSTSTCGSSPQLTLAQGNVRPVTQVSGRGGLANSKPSPPPVVSGLQRDTSQVTTLTELGKKLLEAAKVGDTSQVRRLMAIGAPFASDGPIGNSPLHLAAQNGHYETCDRLLSAGMNKDARNKVDKTPLHLAATEGHTDIVHLLLRSGVNVNACDMLRMTALHWACDRGHTSIVRLLLRYKAQTYLANKFSKTPLHLAIENRHDTITMILQDGISFKTENEEQEDERSVEEEELAQGETIFGLSNIPIVCKTEEVHTEESLVEEVCESTDDQHIIDNEKGIPTVESELPHSIMDDDLEDQNIAVLATLAELAQATKSTDHSVEMSNAAALELLKAQAALLPLDDSSTLVTSAVAHGQTLHLTEAGRQALKLIKPELPLFPSSTLPKEKNPEEEQNKSGANSDTSSRGHTLSLSPIALPPPPPRSPPPPVPLLTLSSSASSTALKPSPQSSSLSSSSLTSSLLSSSSLISVPVPSVSSLPSSSSSLPATSILSSSSSTSKLSSSSLPSSSSASCLSVTSPSHLTEVKEDQDVTQVITLTPEQYAALTNGSSGPVILQILPSDATEDMGEIYTNPSPPAAKRQRIVHLVTSIPGTSSQQVTVAKVIGQ